MKFLHQAPWTWNCTNNFYYSFFLVQQKMCMVWCRNIFLWWHSQNGLVPHLRLAWGSHDQDSLYLVLHYHSYNLLYCWRKWEWIKVLTGVNLLHFIVLVSKILWNICGMCEILERYFAKSVESLFIVPPIFAY